MNPVVLLPLPVALFLLALLAYAAICWADKATTWPTWEPTGVRRHRVGTVAEPYRPRPWTDIADDLPDGPAPGYVPVIPGIVVEPDTVILEPAEDAFTAADYLDPTVPLHIVEARAGLHPIVADWFAPLPELVAA